MVRGVAEGGEHRFIAGTAVRPVGERPVEIEDDGPTTSPFVRWA